MTHQHQPCTRSFINTYVCVWLITQSESLLCAQCTCTVAELAGVRLQCSLWPAQGGLIWSYLLLIMRGCCLPCKYMFHTICVIMQILTEGEQHVVYIRFTEVKNTGGYQAKIWLCCLCSLIGINRCARPCKDDISYYVILHQPRPSAQRSYTLSFHLWLKMVLRQNTSEFE